MGFTTTVISFVTVHAESMCTSQPYTNRVQRNREEDT